MSAARAIAASASGALVGKERVEHVLDQVVAVAVSPNADADSRKRVEAPGVDERLHAAMAGRAAAELDLDPAEREIRLVVDDDRVPRGAPELGGQLRGGLATEVHEGLGTRGDHVIAVDGSLSHACQSFAPFAAELSAPLELVKAHPADIVPGPRVFASRVAEADDQLGHDRPTGSAVSRSGMSAPGSSSRVAVGHRGGLFRERMVVPEAVEQPVHGEQAKLGHAVRSLPDRALHRDRHVADATARSPAGKREHVGGRVDAEETRVQALKLRVTCQANGQARPNGDVELLAARAQQRPEACLRGNSTLPRAETRVADDGHPHWRRYVRCS